MYIYLKKKKRNLFSVRLEDRIDLGLRGYAFNGWEVIIFFTALHCLLLSLLFDFSSALSMQLRRLIYQVNMLRKKQASSMWATIRTPFWTPEDLDWGSLKKGCLGKVKKKKKRNLILLIPKKYEHDSEYKYIHNWCIDFEISILQFVYLKLD